MRETVDVQKILDDWLESNPDAERYVTKLYYLPDGAPIPADVTHVNRIAARDDIELDLRIGVVATRETAALADLMLAAINRGPQGEPKQD